MCFCSVTLALLCCGMQEKGQIGTVDEVGLKIPFVTKEIAGTICKSRVLISGTL